MRKELLQSIKDCLDDPEEQEMPKVQHLGAKTAAFIIALSFASFLLTTAVYRLGVGQRLGGVFTMLLSMTVSFLLIAAVLKIYVVICRRM